MSMNIQQAAEQLTERRQTAAAAGNNLSEQPERASAETPEPAPAEPEDTSAEPETPDVDGEPEEPAEEPQADASENPDETSEDEDDRPFETVDELAEALGVSSEDLLAQLRYKTKINGRDVERTLSEFLAESSKGEDYTAKTQKLAEQRKEFERVSAARLEALEQEHAGLNGAFQTMRQRVLDTLNSDYVRGLQGKDPGQWAALNQQVQQEVQQLDHMFNQARQQYEQNRQKVTQAFLQQQNERLLEARPDFGQADAEKIQGQLWRLGFSPEETKMIGQRGADARLLLGTLELAELREENEQLKAKLSSRETTAKMKLKRKRDPGPVQKPGSSRTASQMSQTEELNALKKVQKTHKLDDAVAVLKARRARRAKRK